MGQNLRALFQSQQIPTSLDPIITEYERAFQSDIRGTFLHDNLSFDDTFRNKQEEPRSAKDLSALPKAMYQLLQKWISQRDVNMTAGYIPSNVFRRQKIGRLGQIFQIATVSAGDSNIVYKLPSQGDWSAGSIIDIFSHTRYKADGEKVAQTFFVVQEYVPLSPTHRQLDHYAEFPELGGRLFYKKFKPNPVLIAVDDVVCHASYMCQSVSGIEEEFIHLLPLDKVRCHCTFRDCPLI